VRAAPSIFVAPEGGGKTCQDENSTEDTKGRVEMSVLQGKMRRDRDAEQNDAPGRSAVGRAMRTRMQTGWWRRELKRRRTWGGARRGG